MLSCSLPELLLLWQYGLWNFQEGGRGALCFEWGFTRTFPGNQDVQAGPSMMWFATAACVAFPNFLPG